MSGHKPRDVVSHVGLVEMLRRSDNANCSRSVVTMSEDVQHCFPFPFCSIIFQRTATKRFNLVFIRYQVARASQWTPLWTKSVEMKWDLPSPTPFLPLSPPSLDWRKTKLKSWFKHQLQTLITTWGPLWTPNNWGKMKCYCGGKKTSCDQVSQNFENQIVQSTRLNFSVWFRFFVSLSLSHWNVLKWAMIESHHWFWNFQKRRSRIAQNCFDLLGAIVLWFCVGFLNSETTLLWALGVHTFWYYEPFSWD